MAKPKKIPAKIVQVCMTHDGRISSVLYEDGRVFLYTYTDEPFGRNPGQGFWAELTYPDTKVETKRRNTFMEPDNTEEKKDEETTVPATDESSNAAPEPAAEPKEETPAEEATA